MKETGATFHAQEIDISTFPLIDSFVSSLTMHRYLGTKELFCSLPAAFSLRGILLPGDVK